MKLDAASLIARHRAGVLLDANLLLLWLVGQYDRNLIGRHKRTAVYTTDDFQLLDRLARRFTKRFTTPHVLTEVSNLATQIGKPIKSNLLNRFWSAIPDFTEEWTAAGRLAEPLEMRGFGLTDAACSFVARQGVLLLSVDYRLVNRLQKLQLPAVNFNHLRSFH